MWLRISFFADRPALLAAVALDGNIYFKASEIGAFLGYANIYAFANRHATKNLNEIIPPEFVPRYSCRYPNSFPTFRVVNFDDMVFIIRKTVQNHPTPFGDNLLKEFQELWNFGSVSNDMFPKLLPVSPRVAFALKVQPAGTQNMSLQEWIHKFVDMTLKMFERNKTTSNSRIVDGIKIKREEDLDMIRKQFSNENSSFPQVEENYILNLSSSAKNAIDLDNNYLYWTPPPSVLNPSNYNEDDNDEMISESMECPSPSHVDRSLLSLSAINSSDQNNDNIVDAEINSNIVTHSKRIFEITYDGFNENFPEEIHIFACGEQKIYVNK